MIFNNGQEAILLDPDGKWREVIVEDYEGDGWWNIRQGDMTFPVPGTSLAIRNRVPQMYFVTIAGIAKKNKVTPMTVWTWLWKLQIEPHYVGESKDITRKGVMAILDVEQDKQLHDWLVKTGRIK